MPREEKLFVGINKDLEEKIVSVPDTDPKPWDGKDELKYIGKKIPRVDGIYKTTGRAKYTYDIQVPGMVFGKINPFQVLSDVSYQVIIRVTLVLMAALLIIGGYGVVFLHRVAGRSIGVARE